MSPGGARIDMGFVFQALRIYTIRLMAPRVIIKKPFFLSLLRLYFIYPSSLSLIFEVGDILLQWLAHCL